MVGTSEAFQQMSADIAELALNNERAGSASCPPPPGECQWKVGALYTERLPALIKCRLFRAGSLTVRLLQASTGDDPPGALPVRPPIPSYMSGLSIRVR